jgi:hypothetical protein
MIRKFALLTLTITALMLTPFCHSQNQEHSLVSEIEVAKAEIRVEKSTMISAAMNFTDNDASAFWPIYRRYEYERSSLNDLRGAVIKEYAEKYPNLPNADAKAMTEEMLDYDCRIAALKKKYFNKFNKALPAFMVTKFFQLDHRIDLMIDMKVEASLPPLTAAQYTDQEK